MQKMGFGLLEDVIWCLASQTKLRTEAEAHFHLFFHSKFQQWKQVVCAFR